MQPLRHVSQMRQKVFLQKATKKLSNNKENCRRRANPKVNKPFSQLHQVKFTVKVVSSLLAADIPLHKLNHLFLKSQFVTMRKVLPSKTPARAYVAKLASEKEQIQELLRDKKYFNCG